MAISIIATVSADAGSGNPSVTHGLTILSGDKLVAIVNANGPGNTVTDNNGSTSFTNDDWGENLDSARTYIFSRVAGASEPSSYNWTLGSSNRWSVIIQQTRGVDDAIWDVAPSAANRAIANDGDATAEAPAITIATSGAMAMVLMGDDLFPTTTTFSSVNNSYANAVSEAGQQLSVIATKEGLSTGSTGVTTITCSANISYVIWQVALKPASTPADVFVEPTFVAAGAQTVTVTIGATLSPALPAGWAVGDLLVMIIAGRCNGSAITNTFGNTWTLAGERFREIGAGATDLYIGVYTRFAEAGETAPTVTPDADFLTSSTTGGVSAQIAGYRWVSNTLDVAAAVNDAAAAATWTPPSVTTQTPRALVVSCVATADDNALNHNTANGFTLVMSGASYDTTTGSDHAVGMSYLVQTTPGAVTMNIWNESAVGNDAWVGVTLAFTPGVTWWNDGKFIRQALNRSTNY